MQVMTFVVCCLPLLERVPGGPLGVEMGADTLVPEILSVEGQLLPPATLLLPLPGQLDAKHPLPIGHICGEGRQSHVPAKTH